MSHPPIVSREQWQAERRALLVEERAHTRAQDALNAQRRRLPMTRVDDSYTFGSTAGTRTFADLFEGRPQLIVYHNMLAPDSDHVCPGCSFYCAQDVLLRQRESPHGSAAVSHSPRRPPDGSLGRHYAARRARRPFHR